MDFTMEMKNGDKATVQTNQIIRCLRNGVQLDKDFLADVIDNLAYKANEAVYYKKRCETVAEKAKYYKNRIEELEELKEENKYLKRRLEESGNANKRKRTAQAEYVSSLKIKHDIEVKDLKDKIHTAKMLNKFYRHELKRRGIKFIKMDDSFGHHVNVMNGTEIDSSYLIKVANMTEEELDSVDNE